MLWTLYLDLFLEYHRVRASLSNGDLVVIQSHHPPCYMEPSPITPSKEPSRPRWRIPVTTHLWVIHTITGLLKSFLYNPAVLDTTKNYAARDRVSAFSTLYLFTYPHAFILSKETMLLPSMILWTQVQDQCSLDQLAFFNGYLDNFLHIPLAYS